MTNAIITAMISTPSATPTAMGTIFFPVVSMAQLRAASIIIDGRDVSLVREGEIEIGPLKDPLRNG